MTDMTQMTGSYAVSWLPWIFIPLITYILPFPVFALLFLWSKTMKIKILALILAIALWFGTPQTASADGILVKCKDSPAYMEKVASYPNNYYFNEPDRAYSEYLSCGEDGLPHLVISLKNTVDIAIAFSIFFYIFKCLRICNSTSIALSTLQPTRTLFIVV